jgi:hypothetical protein
MNKNKCIYSDKIINIAAQYWINIIKSGKDHDNGDNSLTGFFCSHWANESTEELETEKLEKFRKAFFKEFKKVVKEYPRESEMDLYCDYGPGWVLSEAAEEAGIDTIQFPWKTGITIGPDYIRECKPYARKSFKDSLIYCEHSYLQSLIVTTEKRIKNLSKEKWMSEELKKDWLKDYQDDLKVYKELLETIPDSYVREDLR